jgi:hypothetical protein
MYTFSWLPYESRVKGKFRVQSQMALFCRYHFLRVPNSLDKSRMIILSLSDFARNMVCVFQLPGSLKAKHYHMVGTLISTAMFFSPSKSNQGDFAVAGLEPIKAVRISYSQD